MYIHVQICAHVYEHLNHMHGCGSVSEVLATTAAIRSLAEGYEDHAFGWCCRRLRTTPPEKILIQPPNLSNKWGMRKHDIIKSIGISMVSPCRDIHMALNHGRCRCSS